MSDTIMLFNISDTNLTPHQQFILINVFGYILTVLLFIMLLPQVYKAWKYECTDDISYKYIAVSFVAEVIDCCYGILINQIPVLVTAILITIESLLLLIAKIKFDSPRDIKELRKSTRVQEIEKRKSQNLTELTDLNDQPNLNDLTEVIIEEDSED